MRLAVLSSSALLFTAASAQIAAPATPGQAQQTGSTVVSRVAATTTAAAGQPVPGQSSAAPTSQQQPVNPNLSGASSAASTGINATASSAPASSTAAVPSKIAAGLAATHTVMVGGAGNKFFPDMFKVTAGDTVVFSFATSTHNVIQSDTNGSCAKSTSPTAFQFPQAGGLAAQATTFTYTVPAMAKNIWFYCSPHCQAGMVGGLLLGGATADGNSTAAGTGVSGAGGGNASSGVVPAATGAPTSSASGSFVPYLAIVAAVVALTAATF